MYMLYNPYELTDQDLKDACEFDDDDLTIGNQTQIDFVLITDSHIKELSREITRNLNHCQYSFVNGSFRGTPKSVFIFWH